MIAELAALVPHDLTGPQAAVVCTMLVCLTVAAGWLADRVFSS
jgi:hypothetical protein